MKLLLIILFIAVPSLSFAGKFTVNIKHTNKVFLSQDDNIDNFISKINNLKYEIDTIKESGLVASNYRQKYRIIPFCLAAGELIGNGFGVSPDFTNSAFNNELEDDIVDVELLGGLYTTFWSTSAGLFSLCQGHKFESDYMTDSILEIGNKIDNLTSNFISLVESTN
jgi:hypothetical protein